MTGLPLTAERMATCPECGLTQPFRRFRLPPWPSVLLIGGVACGPAVAMLTLAILVRPWLSVFTGPMRGFAFLLAILMPPIASVFAEKVSLRRRQRSPWLLALGITFGGWAVNLAYMMLIAMLA